MGLKHVRGHEGTPASLQWHFEGTVVLPSPPPRQARERRTIPIHGRIESGHNLLFPPRLVLVMLGFGPSISRMHILDISTSRGIPTDQRFPMT